MRISKFAALLGVAAMFPGYAQAQDWRDRGGGGVRAERGERPDRPQARPDFNQGRGYARPDRPGGFQPQAARIPDDHDMMQPRGRPDRPAPWANDAPRPDVPQPPAERGPRPEMSQPRPSRPDWNQNRGGGDARNWGDRRGWNMRPGDDDRQNGWGRGDRGDWQDRARSNMDWRDHYRSEGNFYDRQRFNNDWRRNQRYDWRQYRDANRYAYRLPRYYAPYGWDRGYRRFGIGVTLGTPLFAPGYWITDPYAYRLPPFDGPYRWVRYYDDALLVDIRTGYVVDVVYGIFW